jgi:hypothetical protein
MTIQLRKGPTKATTYGVMGSELDVCYTSTTHLRCVSKSKDKSFYGALHLRSYPQRSLPRI